MAYVDGSKTRGGRAYRQSQGFKEHIRRRDNYTCQLCGKEGWIVDHIIPYAISHETTPNGTRVLCHACNLLTRKERRQKLGVGLPLDEWYAWLEKWANQT